MTDDLLLRLVQDRYGEQWRISRTETMWVAVAHDPDADHARTVVHTDLDRFLAELESPPAATGPQASMVRARYFADRAETRAAGCWFQNQQPT